MKKITVLKVPADGSAEAPELVEVFNNFPALAEAIDANYITIAPQIIRDVVVICDEEGLLAGKEPNRVNNHMVVPHHRIVGDVLIAGQRPTADGDVFADLSVFHLAAVCRLLDIDINTLEG